MNDKHRRQRFLTGIVYTGIFFDQPYFEVDFKLSPLLSLLQMPHNSSLGSSFVAILFAASWFDLCSLLWPTCILLFSFGLFARLMRFGFMPVQELLGCDFDDPSKQR